MKTMKTAKTNGVAIELQHDDGIHQDGKYRWYETATGTDTEVSGRTVEEAIEVAAAAFPGFELEG